MNLETEEVGVGNVEDDMNSASQWVGRDVESREDDGGDNVISLSITVRLSRVGLTSTVLRTTVPAAKVQP